MDGLLEELTCWADSVHAPHVIKRLSLEVSGHRSGVLNLVLEQLQLSPLDIADS